VLWFVVGGAVMGSLTVGIISLAVLPAFLFPIPVPVPPVPVPPVPVPVPVVLYIIYTECFNMF
jgi:hypothetical protein